MFTTKKTRVLSAFCVFMMLVSLLTCFALPVSAASNLVAGEVVQDTGLYDASALPDIKNGLVTGETKYKLTDRAGMNKFADIVNFDKNNLAGYTIYQMADIDMGTAPFEGIGVPGVGTKTHFAGTFDGNGFVIENLFVYGVQASGLFGNASDATFKNIGIASGLVAGGFDSGAICGNSYASTFINCWVASSSIGGSRSGGAASAISGYTGGGCKFYNCYNVGLVCSGVYFATGLIGRVATDTELRNSYNAGDLRYCYYNQGTTGYVDTALYRNSDVSILTETAGTSNSYYRNNLGFAHYNTERGKSPTEFADGTVAQLLNTAADPSQSVNTLGAVDGYTVAYSNIDGYDFPVLTYSKDGVVKVCRLPHTTVNVYGDSSAWMGASDVFARFLPSFLGGYKGLGTITVDSANDLYLLGLVWQGWNNPNDYGITTVEITKDIDMKDVTLTNIPRNAEGIPYCFPLGGTSNQTSQVYGFHGVTLEGNGHNIYNWNVYSPNNGDVGNSGLVGFMSTGTVQNVNLVGATVTRWNDLSDYNTRAGKRAQSVGLLVGCINGAGTINNCTASGKVVYLNHTNEEMDRTTVGGLVGSVNMACTISNSWSDTTIVMADGSTCKGGLIGYSRVELPENRATNLLYGAPEVVNTYNGNCQWVHENSLVVASNSAEFAYMLGKMGKGQYTLVNGNIVPGEPGPMKLHTIFSVDGEEMTELSYTYYVPGEEVTAPVLEGFELDRTSLPAGADETNTFIMPPQEVVLRYTNTAVTLQPVYDVIEKLNGYDLDLFVDATPAIAALNDAYDMVELYSVLDGQVDDKMDVINKEMLDLVKLVNTLQMTLVDTYPHVVPYADRELYAQFGQPSGYMINTVEDWCLAATSGETFAGLTLHLGDDIFADGFFIPSMPVLEGTLNGHGHVFSELTMQGEIVDAPFGLIGTLAGTGVIRDLGIEYGIIDVLYSADLDDYGVGALVGEAKSGAVIQNCWNGADVTVVSTSEAVYENPVAGLIGIAESGVTMNLCYNVGTITGGDRVADLVNGDVTVYNSFGAGVLNCTPGFTGYVVGGYEGATATPNLVNVYAVGERKLSMAKVATNALEDYAYYSGEVGYIINQTYVPIVETGIERSYFTWDEYEMLALGTGTLEENKAAQLRKFKIELSDGSVEYLYIPGGIEYDLAFAAYFGDELTLADTTYATLDGTVVTVKPVTDADADKVVVLTATVSELDATALLEALFYFMDKDPECFADPDAILALIEKIAYTDYTIQAEMDADAAALAALKVYTTDPTKLPDLAFMYTYYDAPGYTVNDMIDLEVLASMGSMLPANCTVYLNTDLDMGGQRFQGVGGMTANFDGLGHTIYNYTEDTAFFAGFNGSFLKNVNFADASVSAESVVADYLIGDVLISGVCVENSTVYAPDGIAAGLVVGNATGNITVENCQVVNCDSVVATGVQSGLVVGSVQNATFNNVGVFNCGGTATALIAANLGTVTASNIYTGFVVGDLFTTPVAVNNAQVYAGEGYASVDAMNNALVGATAKWNMNGETEMPALVLPGKHDKYTITFEKNGATVATGYTDVNGKLYAPEAAIVNGYWDVKGPVTDFVFTGNTTVIAKVVGDIVVKPIGVAKPGEYVKVEVSINNNPGLKGTTFVVRPDFDKFEVVNLEDGGKFAYFVGLDNNAPAPVAPFKVLVAGSKIVDTAEPLFVLTLRVKDGVANGNHMDAVVVTAADSTDGNHNVSAFNAGSAAITVVGNDFLWGDVNASTVVEPVDVTLVLRDTVGIATPEMTQPAAGELDGRAGLSVVDAQMILWHLGTPGSVLQPVGAERPNSNLQAEGTPFNVKQNETVWFGPADPAQQTLLVYNDGADTNVGVSGVTEVATLGGGYKIYSYTAPADGSVTVTAPAATKDIFLVSKAVEMNEAKYYQYFSDQDGINLYNSVLDNSNVALNWKGEASASTTMDLTHAIAVEAGDTVTVGPVSMAQVTQGYAYDLSGNPIGLLNATNMIAEVTFDSGMVLLTYTVPAGVGSVRFNVPADMSGKYVIVKNTEFTASVYQMISGINPAVLADPLSSAAGLFAGDSINHGLSSRDEAASSFPGGTGGWAARIERDTGLDATNAGTSGWFMVNYNHATYDSIHKLLDKYTANDYQYVLLQGGTNDISKMSSVGTVSDSFDPATFDQSTYAGALEYTIYKAIKLYGDNAAIGFTSTIKLRNDNPAHAQIYAVAEEVCEKWGIAYLDLYNNEVLNTALAFDTNEHTNDGTHPDASGYELITPYVIEYMRTMNPCSQEVLTAVLG